METVLIPATNDYGINNDVDFNDVSFQEFIRFLGILYSMEVYHLPERRMYWNTQPDGIFPAMNYGKIMGRNRFEEILQVIKLSHDEDQNVQLQDFINAVNENFKVAMSPGSTICLDESMVKSYHRNLRGKMKIKRKLRPIGNEFKTMSDGRSKIILHMEMYEGKEYMASKRHVQELGATSAMLS